MLHWRKYRIIVKFQYLLTTITFLSIFPLLTFKDLGLLPNEKTPYLCFSNGKRVVIFCKQTNILQKSIYSYFAWIRLTPKNRPFTSRNFLALISNFLFESTSLADIFKVFPNEMKCHVILTNLDVFALFLPPWTFRQPPGWVDPKFLQIAS